MPIHRVLDAEVVARNTDIIARIKAGESLTSVGGVYGLSRQRVHAIAKRAGISGGWIVRAERLKAAAELHKQGKTIPEIARALGARTTDIYRTLNNYGLIEKRPADSLLRSKGRLKAAAMIAINNGRMTWAEIGSACGLSMPHVNVIASLLRNMGIEAKPKHPERGRGVVLGN